uniref:Uncharacterized protein n=1 Tax=Romanomermis culicivorax TaxID=13658 RepID=A0A915KIV3_ROMCU
MFREQKQLQSHTGACKCIIYGDQRPQRKGFDVFFSTNSLHFEKLSDHLQIVGDERNIFFN